MANIIFKIQEPFYILSDFTEETLDKIANRMQKINRDTGSNECNFYDFEDLLTFENLKEDTKKSIEEKHYGLEFTRLEINCEIYRINKKIKMQINTLATFKGYILETIIVSKTYQIESNHKNIIKLKDVKKEIDLKKVKYEYSIT